MNWVGFAEHIGCPATSSPFPLMLGNLESSQHVSDSQRFYPTVTELTGSRLRPGTNHKESECQLPSSLLTRQSFRATGAREATWGTGSPCSCGHLPPVLVGLCCGMVGRSAWPVDQELSLSSLGYWLGSLLCFLTVAPQWSSALL